MTQDTDLNATKLRKGKVEMRILQVPPFVEVAVAKTDEEMALLRRQYAFVKPPVGGTSRSRLEDVLKQWSQQIMTTAMRDPAPAFPRLDGEGPLSTASITQMVEVIIDRFDGMIDQNDVFYLVYPPANSRLAAGIRNTLQVAEVPKTTEWEINGMSCRLKRPFTYWLPVSRTSTHGRVKLAFYQSALFQDDDGPNGWRLLKHRPAQPILRWYVPPTEPALKGEGTFAMANTFEVEEKAFTVLRDAAERSGAPLRDVIDHPNGKRVFPDYKASIGAQPWAIEMVRPLGDMVNGRVIIMGNERSASDIKRAGSGPDLGSNAIGEALRNEITKKTHRRKLLAQVEKYCLVLVDTMGLVDPEDPDQWERCKLDQFDSVVLVQLVPERPTDIVAISGDISLNAAAQAPAANGGLSARAATQ